MKKEFIRQFYKKNKLNLILSIISSILLGILMLAISIMLQVVIDIASNGTINQLYKVGLLFIGLVVVGILVYLLNNTVIPCFVAKAIKQYKQYAFSLIVKQSNTEFKEKGQDQFVSSLTNDIVTIENEYIAKIPSLVFNIVIFIGALVLMFINNYILTIVGIVLSLLPFVLTLLFGPKIEKNEVKVAKSNEDFLHLNNDVLSGYSVIKSFKVESKIISLFNKSNEDLEKAKTKKNKLALDVEGIITIASIVAQFGVFFVGAYLCLTTSNFTAGSIVLFVQLMNYVVGPLGQIPQIIAKRSAAIPLINKMSEICKSNENLNETLATFDNNITFKNVTFKYDEKVIIDNFSYTFEKNKSYAIVGPSGAGKSTILNLLMGLYKDYEGSINYDENEISILNQDSIYDVLSLIEQKVFMFDASLYNNITMYNEYSKDEIDDAINKANLVTLVNEKGIDYVCGQGGGNLSGGERQRISIARSLLKKSKLLLVDEATSALDNQTSLSISNEILALKDTTKIVITHRLDEVTLRKYDHILVLKDGKLVEYGSFDKLVNENGLFSSMYKISM